MGRWKSARNPDQFGLMSGIEFIKRENAAGVDAKESKPTMTVVRCISRATIGPVCEE